MDIVRREKWKGRVRYIRLFEYHGINRSSRVGSKKVDMKHLYTYCIFVVSFALFSIAFTVHCVIIWAMYLFLLMKDLLHRTTPPIHIADDDDGAIDFSEMPGGIDNIRETLKGKK